MNEMNSKLELVYLNPAELMAHPENRGVENGPEMEELKLSISELGVIQPLTVRRKEGEIWPEILAGHRRAAAARAIGLAAVPCIVRVCSDEEAMAFLFVENFERLSLNAIEEAEGMEAWMRVCDVGVDEVAGRIARPVEYVQAMLHLNDLPTPARKLVREGGVSRETLLVLGRVEDECFQEAVQMVLFPSIQSMPLNARQARDVIKNEIELPMKRKRDWNAKREKLLKQFGKTYKACGLKIVVPLWEELEAELYSKGDWVSAHAAMDFYAVSDRGMEFVTPGMEGQVIWGELAGKHGLTGVVKPVGGAEMCLVRADLVCEVERSMAAAGMESFLRAAAKGGGKQAVSADEGDEWEDEEKNEGPPDERHVRRETGSMVLVPRDKVERAVELLGLVRERSLSVDEMFGLPKVFLAAEATDHVVFSQKAVAAKVALQWVLDGCPLVGDEEKAAD